MREKMRPHLAETINETRRGRRLIPPCLVNYSPRTLLTRPRGFSSRRFRCPGCVVHPFHNAKRYRSVLIHFTRCSTLRCVVRPFSNSLHLSVMSFVLFPTQRGRSQVQSTKVRHHDLDDESVSLPKDGIQRAYE